MADTYFAPVASRKRGREDYGENDDIDAIEYEARLEKKARPGSGDSSNWAQDSVLNTPKSTKPKPKYDSDDQSSMMSEPGSPQDISMSDDEMEDDDSNIAFSCEAPNATAFGGPLGSSSPWQARMNQANRVPTPILPPPNRPQRSMELRTGAVTRAHVRQRHPQENLSSSTGDHLEVPSPIDEDEIPTPPSAAEAAGSQLSMLTVNDMDMEPSTQGESIPSIAIDPSQAILDEHVRRRLELESAIDSDMDSSTDEGGRLGRDLIIRKTRARSGALSSGQSPVRADPERSENGPKRGFSMGYRPDCEKCRMRVPGHMNHFIE